MIRYVLLGLAAGCPRSGSLPATFGEGTRWEVAVLAAKGDGEIEAHYELLTEKVGSTVWMVSTTRTNAHWIMAGDTASFDSADPTPADPWPLTLQHLVASVPAKVKVEQGRPVAILDEEEWADAARRAVYGSKLPSEAIPAGEALVDSEGLLADLARTFPGSPVGGTWERTEKIAGIRAQLSESCAFTEDIRQWSCKGTAKAAPEESAQLYEVKTYTEISVDKDGLRSVETGYSGTLVTMAPGGNAARDQPITGFRRVVRKG